MDRIRPEGAYRRSPRRNPDGLIAAAAGLAVALMLACAPIRAAAQTLPAQPGAAAVTAKPLPRTEAEEGVRWDKLKPAQRESLKPLQQEWSRIEAARKQKWLELADRMPAMPPDERARVQTRMADWARLTPVERGQARLRFEQAKQIPLPDRRSRWEAYQALSPEQKAELADRAAFARSEGAESPMARRPAGTARADANTKPAQDFPQAKSNIVPNSAFGAPLRPIGPTVVQVAPGATTTLVTRRPTPPAHQQTGLPKIAATPEFVNRSTLLPQRGPQGAAVRPVPSSGAASAPRP